MQVRTFKVTCKESVGELVSIKLSLKPFMGYYSEWFCDKIIVRTPEGDDVLFPSYRCLNCEEDLVLSPAKGRLQTLFPSIILYYTILYIVIISCWRNGHEFPVELPIIGI